MKAKANREFPGARNKELKSKAGLRDGAEATCFRAPGTVVCVEHLAVFIMTFSQNFKHTQKQNSTTCFYHMLVP